ncbi:hypothetical protein [Aeromonas phage ZPAH34]|uniref:hypothetical protein n=1 Tax=Aeromonas phage ZPAH34 TaxID=2924888 RepID=UPI002329882A|nr:hypothetical protein PQD16_gp198 [Aeromonas phage ZPAH34]UOX39485.1 hypothetical protein [Aeromonas phage ZPAH34]
MYEDDMEDSGILPNPVENSPADIALKEKEELMINLQTILNKGSSKETESELLNCIQKNRKLMLDVATATFIKKPNNSKLLDSINTLLAGLEKSVRDDRKEKLKDRELEDNKTSFASLVNALKEVSAGKLTLPSYDGLAMILDPLKPITELDEEEQIKEEEKEQGRQEIDVAEIEGSFD